MVPTRGFLMKERISAKEFREKYLASLPVRGRRKRRSKYNAKPIFVGAERFDSRKEYRRYCDLVALEKAGLISNLRRQVKFVLVPASGGQRAVVYVADFVYTDKDGNTIVEDTKGYRTRVYAIKKKLMKHMLGLTITEI